MRDKRQVIKSPVNFSRVDRQIRALNNAVNDMLERYTSLSVAYGELLARIVNVEQTNAEKDNSPDSTSK